MSALPEGSPPLGAFLANMLAYLAALVQALIFGERVEA